MECILTRKQTLVIGIFLILLYQFAKINYTVLNFHSNENTFPNFNYKFRPFPY